jgi:hypothetical protein
MTSEPILRGVKTIEIEAGAPEVCRTVADELAAASGAPVAVVARFGPPAPGVFRVGVSGQDEPHVRAIVEQDGSGFLEASHARFLYGAARQWLPNRSRHLEPGTLHAATPAFSWNRSCYDIFLTQEARIQRGLDPETYVRKLAESGFTHAEVNALASPMAIETGPKGEVYPMFYTYCPALDQFVHSRLNEGLYPYYYLANNLAVLKRNAALARKYGLVPGLLCFEPRSVPEEFFARYPMLRGARVDHPFRSFKPRYTMTLAHPVVREHYAEMLRKLLAEVPDLGFLTIWTNDSGSGFEHTRSLYVGRNGGPYMIREWKDHEEIARVAGEHALRFFRTLRDAAREVHPGFRVITRLESFMGEHDTIWRGLEEGLDVETTSLVARGWEMPYAHPRYPDSHAINSGSVYQQEFAEGERTSLADLEQRGAAAHFYCAAGPHQMFAPLLGVPYPWLTHRRLRLLHENGVCTLSQVGGTCPPELAPFDVNHEIMARFQFNPRMDAEIEIRQLAERWAGCDDAATLVEAWRLAEQAILAYPNVCTLYSTIGFTWYRLWARPLVPDIEAIPAGERAYYQAFMCTTPHNPNNVDLGRDVLFRLITADQGRRDAERIDQNVWGPLDAAIALLEGKAEAWPHAASREGASGDNHTRGTGLQPGVLVDQLVRLGALRCWIETQRNVAAWVGAVYGWMEAGDDEAKAVHRRALDDLVRREIANSRRLIELLDSGIEFMATTDLGETPLIHGRNLKSLVERRIALMERHAHDAPFIDHDYMMRVAGQVMA